MKQLAKGTEMITHKMTLLREEVRSLYEANQAFSKRRRAKKTRIRARGTLSIQDTLDLIKPKIIERSEKDQTSSNRSGKQTSSSTSRYYNKYSKTSHNIRIYQEIKETSKEDTEIESD